MAVIKWARGRRGELFPGFTDVAEIGSGSLATVYRARQAGTNRPVALKLLSVHDVSPRALESFRRESVALGALSAHPNIVTLYETFQTADARPVLVLELCAGSIVDQVRAAGAQSAQRVVAVGIKMAAALETTHRAEILHRDVKPQNILITEFGEPALADFGVAILQASSQTTSGLFDFTTLHVAPELLEGRPASPATDVYELASTLYQLVSGESAFRSFEGESPASVILRILRDPVRPLVTDGVPVQLSDLLVAAMSKDQQSRPSTAAEFAAALTQVEAAQGWARTPFLVRGMVLPLPGQAAVEVPPPAAVAGTPASVAARADRAVLPVDRGSRPDAPVGVRAGAPEHGPRQVVARSPAPDGAPAPDAAPVRVSGLSRTCERGHLVSAAVQFCPICGSSALAAVGAPGPKAGAPAPAPPPAHDPWNPVVTARTATPAARGPQPSPPPPQYPIPPQPPPAAPRQDRPGRAPFPIPPRHRPPPEDAAAVPVRDPAALSIEWGAVRAPAAGVTPPAAARPRPPRLVLRARPSASIPGSVGWASGVALGWVASTAVVAVGGFASIRGGLATPIAVAITAAVAIAAGWLAVRLALPTLVVDSAGITGRGQRHPVRLGWPDVVQLGPHYLDSARGIVVAHTRTGPTALVATARPSAELAGLTARLDAYRSYAGTTAPR